MYWEIIVEGKVQGVGFRQAAKDLAEKEQLVGFAENMADGHVHIEVSGDDEALLRYYEELKTIPQDEEAVVNITVVQEEKEFKGFDIR